MPETLASEKNPLLKEVRRAIARGSLTNDGLAVAEGFHLLEEALRSRCEIAAVISSPSVKDEFLAQPPKSARVLQVSDQIVHPQPPTYPTQRASTPGPPPD